MDLLDTPGVGVKLRQLAVSALVAAFSLAAWAADRPAAISGYVRDASGTPQMGAVVQIAGVAARNMTVFTDGTGFFSATGLLPGIYSVRVSAPSFLPAMLEKVGLHAGSTIQVKVTLNTLLNAVNVGPLRQTENSDDWKWTLRSVANRPVLRVFDDPAKGVERQDHDVKTSLSFLAGSTAAGYGSGSDMSTGFSVERPVFTADRVEFTGSVGYGDGSPGGFLRAMYSHMMPDGNGPTMAITMRRFAPSDPNLHNEALQSLALNMADDVTVADVLELKFGSELESVQFLGTVNAFRPYGSANLHVSPNTVLAYNYATSLPVNALANGFDNGDGDLIESDPRISVESFATKLESAHHQELSVSHRMGSNSMQLALFDDHINNTALIGAGEVTAAGGDLLPDVYSGTFTYSGHTLDSRGVRVVLERKFSSELSTTLDYAYGGALNLTKPGVELQQARQWINSERRHAVAAKLSGHLPGSHTQWATSYRWVSGSALTPVDMFNASPGETAPFLNVLIRQPIPTMGFLPAHMEAMIDLRNLLAQGYVPVVGRDGQTVYLVQAARSVRGGVAITF